MGNLICSIKGHQWVNGKCHRCGLVCQHESLQKYDECTEVCEICRCGFAHHNWQDTDMPWKKVCSVCGKEDIDGNELILWERAEKKRKEEEEIQKKKDRLNKMINKYMIGDDKFRCMCCEKTFSLSDKSATYDRPICKECAKKVKSYYGHTVIDVVDMYDRTVTCINCFKREDWHDAEHQGALLQDMKCEI